MKKVLKLVRRKIMRSKRFKSLVFVFVVIACAITGICVGQREKQYRSFFVEGNDAGAVIAPTMSNDEEAEEVIKVNINTDNVYELMQVEGIGEKTAERIIEYRKENGNFEVIEDVMRVDGIGEKKFNDMKEQIFVE